MVRLYKTAFLALVFSFLLLTVTGTASAQKYKAERDDLAFRDARQILEECVACHTLEENGEVRLGPNLFGLYGREIASIAGYEYSDALKARNGVWDQSNLMGYLERPNYFAEGSAMHFQGIPKFLERKKLIDWFKAQQKGEVDVTSHRSLQEVLARGNSVAGRSEARRCLRCHRFGKNEGNGVGPNLYGVVGRPIGALPDYEYSDGLVHAEGIWTEERLYRFLVEKVTSFKPGSHMVKIYLDTPLKRANVVAYLKSISPDAPEAAAAASDE